MIRPVVVFLLLIFFIPLYAAHPARPPKPVKYACEEYRDLLVKLSTDGRVLVPWPSYEHPDMTFLDGVFLSDDDSKVVVILLKKDPSISKFGHRAIIKKYDTADKTFTDIAAEELGDRQSITIVKAGSSGFSFLKTPADGVSPVELVTYPVNGGARSSVPVSDKGALERRLFYGKFDVSGMSLEPKANDYNRYINARRMEVNNKLYDGLAIADKRLGTNEEVLRFGNNPRFLRHSDNIIFDFKDRMNFMFGFYNVKSKSRIYYMDGNNMVFRHYEKGVPTKEYLFLTSLRAVNMAMTKLLFMAEDDFGPRLVILPFDPKRLSN